MNYNSFAHQLKATEKIIQISTIFMFMTKSNSKQKRLKNTQERETGIRPLNSSLGEHCYWLWRETTSTR